MAYTVSKILEIARGELGYKEKETNSQLDNPTANAGDGNWTKYARDLHSAGYYQAAKNGYAWCDMFVDWCFWKLAGGKERGEWLECQTGLYGAGCEWSSACYRRAGRFDKNPRPGDQIFFGKTGSEDHTGIVEKIENGKVYTIEGNASNMVKRCTYTLTNPKIVGYGHPRFDSEAVDTNVGKPDVTGRPSTGSDSDEQAIWNFLMVHIDNEFGVAGLMGNLKAESALRSTNLQQAYETKLGYNDTAYTEAVDNGSYTNFVKDSAGYGLAQWTYWSRKQKMLEFHRSKNKSIGDMYTQLEFLIKELRESYKSVWADLKNATNVMFASNIVLTKFERPANMGESVQKKRAEYGKHYYDKYADKCVEHKPDTAAPAVLKFKVGDVVNFNGTNHYASANASTGPKVKKGKAKITAISKTGKHQYHCRAVNDACAFVGGVHGWVDATDLTAIVVKEPKPVAPVTPPKSTTIRKGDVVSIAKNATYYSGKDVPDWVVSKRWIVAEAPVGDRVVINKSVDGQHAIGSPIHAKFLTVVSVDKPWTPKVGDIVNYNGNKHYVHANAVSGSVCKGGKAKITNIYQVGRSKHPYHLERLKGKGATVCGWVDEGSFTKA